MDEGRVRIMDMVFSGEAYVLDGVTRKVVGWFGSRHYAELYCKINGLEVVG